MQRMSAVTLSPPPFLAPDEAGIAKAVAVLDEGGIVAIPTETVYGLAADATNGIAVARIFEAKGRPRFNPLICHVDTMAMARSIAVFDPVAEALADRFWPGPLTLVLPLAPGAHVHPLVTAGLETVAVRMPAGPAAAIIAGLGRPIAAPSANASGKISATRPEAVRESLGAAVTHVMDGGPARVGVESTILAVAADGSVTCLRPGGLALETVGEFLGKPVRPGLAGTAILAPGMMASHYAPDMPVRLRATDVKPGEGLLAFGPARIAGAGDAVLVRNLSPSGDLAEAAANLFAMLFDLNRAGPAAIAVEPVPEAGLGLAINDRLIRAAAERPT